MRRWNGNVLWSLCQSSHPSLSLRSLSSLNLSAFPSHKLRSLSPPLSLSSSSFSSLSLSSSSFSSLSLSAPPTHSFPSSLSSLSPFLSLSRFASKSSKGKTPVTPPPKAVKGGIKDAPDSSAANSAKRTNRHGEGDPLRPVCTFEEVTKSVGGRVLLDHVSGTIHYGAKIGILGINGAGKSTFLKILAKVDDEFDGKLAFESNLKIGYLSQEPSLPEDKTVLDVIYQAMGEAKEVWEKYLSVYENLRQLQLDKAHAGEIERVRKEMEKVKGVLVQNNWVNLDQKIQKGLVALRCPPSSALIRGLSGGEKRRVALCTLLLQQPDFLLLDEPTNHLDAESVAYLERFLREYKGTVLAVTHDRFFLENSAGWILEVADGHLYPHKGNYTSWLEAKQKRIESQEKQDKQMQNFLSRELEWIRKPASARQAKNQARVKAYEKLVEQSKARRWESGKIIIPPGKRLGNIVLEVNNLSKSINGKVLFKDLSFDLRPGAIVGIVGPNGAGKTTLLRVLLGELQADEGTVKMGESVEPGYVSQSRASLNDDHTVHEEISNGVYEIDMGGGNMINSRLYTACFHFRGQDQNKLIRHLSGGERNRVHVAKMLNQGFNMLILDEPTNDLDVEVLSSLENALEEFVGCSIIVSHDRWFLNRVCTNIIALDGEGGAEFFEGNYEEYVNSKDGKIGKKGKYISLGL